MRAAGNSKAPPVAELLLAHVGERAMSVVIKLTKVDASLQFPKNKCAPKDIRGVTMVFLSAPAR